MVTGDPSSPYVTHLPHSSTRIPHDVRTQLVLDDGALAKELHLDRGYDSIRTTQRCLGLGLTDVICAKKRRKGDTKVQKATHPGPAMALRAHELLPIQLWPVPPQHDRFAAQRLGQIALAITLILTVKLVKWAQTMDRLTAPICARS